MEEIKRKISACLAAQPYMRISTVSADAQPHVATVGFIAERATVYFVTDRKSRKAQNIAANQRVAYCVDDGEVDLRKIQGVQMTGTASIVTEPAEIQKIMAGMLGKFPQFKDLPPNEDYVFFRVEPHKGVFIDNTIQFGQRDTVTY